MGGKFYRGYHCMARRTFCGLGGTPELRPASSKRLTRHSNGELGIGQGSRRKCSFAQGEWKNLAFRVKQPHHPGQDRRRGRKYLGGEVQGNLFLVRITGDPYQMT